MSRREDQLVVKTDRRGRLYVRPYLGRSPVTGKPWRPWHYLAATNEDEALAEAKAWLADLLGHRRLDDALGEYIRRCARSDNTRRTWETILRNYVAPYVGSMLVRDVSTEDLADLYCHLLDHGSAAGTTLSASTVLGVHWFLRGAYSWFCTEVQWCETNPALAVGRSKPSPSRHEADFLEDWAVAKLEARIGEVLPSDEPTGETWLAMLGAEIALRAGLRCGEVCGLRRRDVRWSSHDLRVCGTVVEGGGDGPRRKEGTKGGGSRNVAMDDDLLTTIEAAQSRLDRALGGVPGPDSPLLTRGSGFLSPSMLARAFSAECRRLGLPSGTRFHTLRHTHASMLIAAGVDLKTVSERLGHRNMETTMRYYAHLLPGRDGAAAQAFALAVRRANGECRA